MIVKKSKSGRFPISPAPAVGLGGGEMIAAGGDGEEGWRIMVVGLGIDGGVVVTGGGS